MPPIPSCCQPTDIKLSEIFARATQLNLQRVLRGAVLDNALHHETFNTGRSSEPQTSPQTSSKLRGQLVHDYGTHLHSTSLTKFSTNLLNITLADLQMAYHLPISIAARKFDVGLTLLKKRSILDTGFLKFHAENYVHKRLIVDKDFKDLYCLQQDHALPMSLFGYRVPFLLSRCRELGLKRWPYRKLRGLDKLIHSIESVNGKDPQVTVFAPVPGGPRSRPL